MIYVGNINNCKEWKIPISYLKHYNLPVLTDYNDYDISKQFNVPYIRKDLK